MRQMMRGTKSQMIGVDVAATWRCVIGQTYGPMIAHTHTHAHTQTIARYFTLGFIMRIAR
jgi:hypothetical protein